MDLRPRRREAFCGFTKPEVQKMKQLLDVFKDEPITEELCKKLARVFSRSTGRAGKPVVKWTEIQSWFHQNQQQGSYKESSSSEANNLTATPETVNQNKATSDHKMPAGMENVDMPRLEFEAKSSKDGAWYDVDTFLSHRPLNSGDIEVYVKYVGFGEEENEWVNSRLVRVRSVALEHSECHKVNVGDLVVCFQESQNQARYYDAYVLEIQRRWHDIRGCRCLFLVRYEHDKEEEKVRLRRLCCRPKRLLMST